jgi:hypothetical protein
MEAKLALCSHDSLPPSHSPLRHAKLVGGGGGDKEEEGVEGEGDVEEWHEEE